jgi:CheY-like chemotaxis protein
VVLPAAEGQIEDQSRLPESLAPEQEAPDGTGQRILIVDDEQSVLRVAARMAERLGLKAMTISDSREAVELVADSQVDLDLALVDMSMPHLDGTQVIRHFRKHRPTMPVILCSGFSEKSLEKDLAECTPDGFLQKPFAYGALESLLNSLAKGTSVTP